MSPFSPHPCPVGDGDDMTAAVSHAPPVPPRNSGSGKTLRSAAGSAGQGPTERRVKCVLVGDGTVGKTSMVVSYTTNGYPTEYVPTTLDNFSEFDKLRPLCYTSADVFMLCFSVVNPVSFHNIPQKWVTEIRTFAPHAPLVLVGTQCDLRDNVKVLINIAKYKERPVDPAEAKDCVGQIGAVTYIQCSSLTQNNVKEGFDTARPKRYKPTTDKALEMYRSQEEEAPL